MAFFAVTILTAQKSVARFGTFIRAAISKISNRTNFENYNTSNIKLIILKMNSVY